MFRQRRKTAQAIIRHCHPRGYSRPQPLDPCERPRVRGIKRQQYTAQQTGKHARSIIRRLRNDGESYLFLRAGPHARFLSARPSPRESILSPDLSGARESFHLRQFSEPPPPAPLERALVDANKRDHIERALINNASALRASAIYR